MCNHRALVAGAAGRSSRATCVGRRFQRGRRDVSQPQHYEAWISSAGARVMCYMRCGSLALYVYPRQSNPRTSFCQFHKGFIYATAHANSVDDRYRVTQDNTRLVAVPAGFEVAPGDADDVRVCSVHPWQSWYLVFADGSACGTSMNPDPSLVGKFAAFVSGVSLCSVRWNNEQLNLKPKSCAVRA